ncbi:MAG TPA: YCF48-related protein [bacterium]
MLATLGILVLTFIGVAILLPRGGSLPPRTNLEPPSENGLRASLAIAVDGRLLKATSSGLFHSADGGQTWEPMQLPRRLAASGVAHLAVNPEAPAVIYAAGRDAGVLLSEDNGTSWRRVTTGLPSLDVEALAMHAFRRKTLFVSVRGKGVYRTEDGGRQWERMDGGPPGKSALVLAHSRLEGSMNTGWLYAGTLEGPYLSMDCF